jgi:hypothetical protein
MDDPLDDEDFFVGEYEDIYNGMNEGKVKVCSFACKLDCSAGNGELEEEGNLITDLHFDSHNNLIQVLHHTSGQQGFVPDEVSYLLTPLLDDDENVCMWSAIHENDTPIVIKFFVYIHPSCLDQYKDNVVLLRQQESVTHLTIFHQYTNNNNTQADDDSNARLPEQFNAVDEDTTNADATNQGSPKKRRIDRSEGAESNGSPGTGDTSINNGDSSSAAGGSTENGRELLGTLATYLPHYETPLKTPAGLELQLKCEVAESSEYVMLDILNSDGTRLDMLNGRVANIIGRLVLEGCICCTVHTIFKPSTFQWICLTIYRQPNSTKSLEDTIQKLKSLLRFEPLVSLSIQQNNTTLVTKSTAHLSDKLRLRYKETLLSEVTGISCYVPGRLVDHGVFKMQHTDSSTNWMFGLQVKSSIRNVIYLLRLELAQVLESLLKRGYIKCFGSIKVLTVQEETPVKMVIVITEKGRPRQETILSQLTEGSILRTLSEEATPANIAAVIGVSESDYQSSIQGYMHDASKIVRIRENHSRPIEIQRRARGH